jgi:hypothetical protein
MGMYREPKGDRVKSAREKLKERRKTESRKEKREVGRRMKEERRQKRDVDREKRERKERKRKKGREKRKRGK